MIMAELLDEAVEFGRVLDDMLAVFLDPLNLLLEV